MKADLLDHGYVRMVSYTQPAERGAACSREASGPPVHDDDHFSRIGDAWTGDLEIVRAARVSHNADWRPEKAKAGTMDAPPQSKDEKLIHYLWKNKHTSPFEAMTFSFEVQAPIFVFRQWHRHRTQSYSEVSARYTELPDIFYVPDPKLVGQQSSKNKQARVLMETDGPDPNAEAFCEFIRMNSEEAHDEYKSFLELGIPRELARLALPVNVYSRMYATANLLNWFRFISLRTDPHAQYEIRIYAEAMLNMLGTVCPIAVNAFKESHIG